MNLIGCGKDVSLPALLPSYVSDVYLLKVTNKRPTRCHKREIA